MGQARVMAFGFNKWRLLIGQARAMALDLTMQRPFVDLVRRVFLEWVKRYLGGVKAWLE